MITYIVKTAIQVSQDFRNLAGDLANPTTVVLTVRSPSGTVTTPSLTNTSTGVYAGMITFDEAGEWTWWWQADGTIIVAGDGRAYARLDATTTASDSAIIATGHPLTEASTTVLGHVKVDGTTITADADGVISAIGAPPSGTAGGVLSGTYPDPSFAADMATQAELYTAIAGRQPLDADLTAIAALSTTTYGRSLLMLADAAAGRASLGLDTPRDLTRVWLQEEFSTGSNANGSVGALGWAFSGGTITMQTSEAGRPGIIRRDTGATINTNATLSARFTAGAGSFHANDTFDVVWIVRVNTVDANTQVRAGAGNDITANPPNDGVYFEKLAADTNWFSVTRSGGTQTRTDMGVAVTTGWVRLRVRRSSGSAIAFSIDGGAETTHTTNIPGTAQMPGAQIFNTAAASKTIDYDYFDLLITGLSR